MEGVFAGLALTVSQVGALLFVKSFPPTTFFPFPAHAVHHFSSPCLVLTEFVGIFVLCNVTLRFILFSFFVFCALCSFSHSLLSLYLLFKTIFIDCRDAETKQTKKADNFCYAWLNLSRKYMYIKKCKSATQLSKLFDFHALNLVIDCNQ